jgi:YVTN family beta-propeller protein
MTNEVATTVPVGVEPHAIIYSPLNNKVFCFNEGSQTFSVIDGATNTVEATESLGTHPWDVVHCPVNDKLYVLGHYPDVLAVVDCGTYAVETPVTFDASPYGVCYDSADNRVYVATRNDSSVRAIDCASNAVVATIKVGPAPNKLCWNSRENKVYTATAEGLDSTVTVIDCATNQVVATLKPGKYPHRLSYEPTESRVYVSNYSSRTVAVIDGATNQVVATIPMSGSPEGSCAVPELGSVFAATRSDTVFVINAASCSVFARVGVGRSPMSLVYNSRDNRVYTNDYYGATVSILRASGGIEETTNDERGTMNAGPTLVRRVLNLQSAIYNLQSEIALLDVTGRAVMALRYGPNDVSRLAPGVYFVRAVSRKLSAVSCQKVVLTR